MRPLAGSQAFRSRTTEGAAAGAHIGRGAYLDREKNGSAIAPIVKARLRASKRFPCKIRLSRPCYDLGVATSGADAANGGLWNTLQGVRFGARERELVVALGQKVEGDGFVLNTEGAAQGHEVRSRRVATLRAARKLERLGLLRVHEITRENQPRIAVTSTRRGRLVYERFEHELLTGERIRWPRSDEPDGRFYHDVKRVRSAP
jgi:hypothetical protein